MPMPPYLLIVEPDFRRLKPLRVLLQGHRHTVRTTDSATDALIMLAGSRPALILVDLGVADAAGKPLAQRIRENPALSRLPVIGLAESTLVSDDPRVAGCTAVVARPADSAALVALVGRLLAEAAVHPAAE